MCSQQKAVFVGDLLFGLNSLDTVLQKNIKRAKDTRLWTRTYKAEIKTVRFIKHISKFRTHGPSPSPVNKG